MWPIWIIVGNYVLLVQIACDCSYDLTLNEDLMPDVSSLTSEVWYLKKMKILQFISFCVSVTGPEFQRVRVGVGHRLDASSSGVLGASSDPITWENVLCSLRLSESSHPGFHLQFLQLGTETRSWTSSTTHESQRWVSFSTGFICEMKWRHNPHRSDSAWCVSGLHRGGGVWESHRWFLWHGSGCGKNHLRWDPSLFPTIKIILLLYFFSSFSEHHRVSDHYVWE